MDPTASTSLNYTLFNATLPPDQLPLEPQITPGWVVAGVILLTTGVVYALVGIKTKWLHTFFSTAFLASLGTTVLILYVMTPPVSPAIQGAYVVAVVCTGMILGGLAIVFKEITECLGCLLGGFCLSMWLLTLQPGGLVPTVGGKVVLIAAFTLGAFGLYFTRWTRAYSIIACTSFSGATAAVLGIDCFSRAGLREFWAFLWALNDHLFPLGASTYPLTRGIRVELAVNILIFLAGIVSQLKLWHIIKEHRDKRNAELAEGERNLRIEEENVGRQVEERTGQARREWERMYGDGDGSASPLGGSADSGVGDMDNEKRMRESNGGLAIVTVQPQSATGTETETPSDGPITSPRLVSKVSAAEMVISRAESDGRVTVMVAQDPTPDDHTVADSLNQEKEGRLHKKDTPNPIPTQNSPPITPLPVVIPLPFKIPEARADEERSSVATFADEATEEDVAKSQGRGNNMESLSRRLSNSSINIFRSMSQRSGRTMRGRIDAMSESREDLVCSTRNTRDDDSLAANMDDTSSNYDSGSIQDKEQPRDTHVETEPAAFNKQNLKQAEMSMKSDKQWPLEHPFHKPADVDGASVGVQIPSKVASDLSRSASPNVAPNSPVPTKRGNSMELSAENIEASAPGPDEEASARGDETKSSKASQSVASVDSIPASLSRGNLPPALSRVALSYRTNEWAKHLSAAETPELDTLQLPELPEEAPAHLRSEEPAPLDVVDLQQTAENAAPRPAAPRSASALSHHGSQPHLVTRSTSRASLSGYSDGAGYAFQNAPTPEPQVRNRVAPYRSMSGTLRGRGSRLFAEPIAEEGDGELSRNIPAPLPEEDYTPPAHYMHSSPVPRELSTSNSTPNLSMWPNSPSVVAYPPSQTLIGMREMLLRSKSQAFINPDVGYGGMPTIPGSGPPSDSGSLHNYPLHSSPIGSGPSLPLDMDDIPLSQRRVMMRQRSMNFSSRGRSSPRATSPRAITPTATADSVPFDSHQPSRRSNVPPEVVRQAQLARFRNSIAADLRNASSSQNLAGRAGLARQSSYGAESPLDGGLLGGRGSMGSLRGAYGIDSDARRSIELQRSMLLGQKEAEAQRREAERQEQERSQREFEDRMRSGTLMEAHRDAMRRLQRGVKTV
ncbi:hypothetical protein B0H63DRAFT_437884 [Podospora didyma]|uniref:TM7S3/TM198-like domain-containing protein n=1 Tax=Podospora didyma TaxID=330526 RepID=A0AAE0N8Q7_9PEZI|nr:hypothetical protein B0H63DRAFT_437884 [Podospora didyma]